MTLIDCWKQAYKLWSVRLMAAAAFVQAVPAEALLYILNLIPADLQAYVPARGWIVFALALLAIVARLVPQPKVTAEASNG